MSSQTRPTSSHPIARQPPHPNFSCFVIQQAMQASPLRAILVCCILEGAIIPFALNHNSQILNYKMQISPSFEPTLTPTPVNKLRAAKKVFLAVLTVCFLGFLVWPYGEPLQSGQCLRDVLHELTSAQNDKLHADKGYRFAIIVGGQVLIDFTLIGVVFLYLTQFQNFYPVAWIPAFYLTRSALQATYKMPFPVGQYWESQGVPTLGVPYGYTRDFFYSGHTGFMVFAIRMCANTKFRPFAYVLVVGLIQVIWLLIVTRGHYGMDIIAGWIFSEWFTVVLYSNLKRVDHTFSSILESITWALLQIWAKISWSYRVAFNISANQPQQ